MGLKLENKPLKTCNAESLQQPSLLSDLGAVAAYSIANLLLPRDSLPKSPSEFGQLSSRQEPQSIQRRRAFEKGRGRLADTPGGIPWRGWKDVIWRTYRQFQQDRILAISAGVVFYGLLAVFPAITALVSLYGLFANATIINEHLSFLSRVMPDAVMGVIGGHIGRVAAKGDFNLSIGFLVGVAVAIWSANAGIKALIDALNIVYEEDEKRGFLKLNLVSLALTIGAILFSLLSICAIVALPLVLDELGLRPFTGRLVELGRWPLLSVGLATALAALYRYAPSRREPQWKWVTVGSVLATIFWIGVSVAFSHYLAKYAHFDVTYGPLGTVIGLMMWMWMSIIVVLLGAELNSEIEHQTAFDTTRGHPKPLGARGATMADTVGISQN